MERTATSRRGTQKLRVRACRAAEGNIGYLDLRGFTPPEIASETAAAAMTFLGGTDAIIFDVRRTVAAARRWWRFSSYLFEGTVHLNDFYSRPTNETRQSWTPARARPQVPRQERTLTSRKTFSGAEEFTYNRDISTARPSSEKRQQEQRISSVDGGSVMDSRSPRRAGPSIL